MPKPRELLRVKQPRCRGRALVVRRRSLHGARRLSQRPESILGVSKLALRPVWNGHEFLPRKTLPLSLSYDHRVINGADAGNFLTFLVAVLGDLRRLLL